MSKASRWDLPSTPEIPVYCALLRRGFVIATCGTVYELIAGALTVYREEQDEINHSKLRLIDADNFLWHEGPRWKRLLTPASAAGLLVVPAGIAPLLPLLQATHSVLDGFIW